MNECVNERNGSIHPDGKNLTLNRRKRFRNRRPADPDSVLRYLRLWHKMSIIQLSEQAGVSADVIVNAERGSFNARVSQYIRLANCLDVSVNDLVEGEISDVMKRFMPKPVQGAVRRGKKLGMLGEQIAMNLEREQLRGTEHADRVSLEYPNTVCESFDLLSFTPDGAPVYVLVKTTDQRGDTPIHFSDGELDFMQRALRNDWCYRIYRLSQVRDEQHYEVRILSGTELTPCGGRPGQFLVKERKGITGVAYWMEKMHRSMEFLGKEIGCAQTQLERLQKDVDHKMGMSHYMALSKALHVPLAALLDTYPAGNAEE